MVVSVSVRSREIFDCVSMEAEEAMSRSTSTLEVTRPKDSPVQTILSEAITSAMSESYGFRPLTSSNWYRASGGSGASSLSCISLPANRSRIPLPVAAKTAGINRSTRDLSLPPSNEASSSSPREHILRRQGSCPPGQILGMAASLEAKRRLPPPVPPKPKGLRAAGAVAKQVLKRESSSPPSLQTAKGKSASASAQQRRALRREASFDSVASGRATPAFSVASTGGVPRRAGSRIPIWTGSQERLNEGHKRWESCTNLEVRISFVFPKINKYHEQTLTLCS